MISVDRKLTWKLWSTCVLDPVHINLVRDVAAKVMVNKQRYEKVAAAFGAPWYTIGVIHYREASFHFDSHLANGDPLRNKQGVPLKTVHVPRGLGPFESWEEGAVAALKHVGWKVGMSWDVTSVLQRLEAYNGLGFRRRGIHSPYVWALTGHYKSGMFVRDGVFNPLAVDHRPGCAALMMALKEKGQDLDEIAVS